MVPARARHENGTSHGDKRPDGCAIIMNYRYERAAVICKI